MEIILKLTAADVKTILESLDQMPHGLVKNVYRTVNEQGINQLKEQKPKRKPKDKPMQ